MPLTTVCVCVCVCHWTEGCARHSHPFEIDANQTNGDQNKSETKRVL